MSNEKQNCPSKRRLPPTIETHSPKAIVYTKALPKGTQSPAANSSKLGQRYAEYEQSGMGSGFLEEAATTPVRTLLSSNVTPRSSSRKARVETSSPTWKGTSEGIATISRPASLVGDDEGYVGKAGSPNGLGLKISTLGQRARSESMFSDGQDSSVSSRQGSIGPSSTITRGSGLESTSKFFHANDLKPNLLSRPLTEQSLHQIQSPDSNPSKEGTIANGIVASNGRTPDQNERKAKFFHANDASEFKSAPLRLSNGNGAPRPQLQTIYSANTANSPPRASSQLKEEILPRRPSVSKPSPRRHTRLVSNGGSEIRSPDAVASGTASISRRSSLNSPRQPRYSTHTRSPSVPTAGPSRRSSIALSDGSPVKATGITSTKGANGSLPHSVEPPNITSEAFEAQSPSPFPPSPTRNLTSGQSKIDQMNELAANARRERKVLDLEISNSSLLAINRTLEREMRKQNAELRRFRRLSRAGRMSIAPSSRSASRNMSLFSETDTVIDSDDLVSSSEEEEEDGSSDCISEGSIASANSHPSSPTQRAARARFQDPSHIELDLTSHRALLSDSRKLNVSIRRCLAHSEALISSGKRALQCLAQVPEKEHPAARVLTPDEVNDDYLGQGQALLSPNFGQQNINPWERSLENIKYSDTGLETPDYSQWGPPTEVQTPLGDFKDSSLGNGSIDSQPSDHEAEETLPDGSPEDRRASEIASIDGLDDERDGVLKEEAGHNAPTDAKGDGGRPFVNNVINQHFRMASPERKEKVKTPEPGQPGYRGSMQGLGHYLQAFSIFGASQQS